MHETRNKQRTYDEVLADAVRVLTEAAGRAIAWTDADGVEHSEQADWAEFVTHALAGAAANVGGVEPILAGRPGSWEADKLRDLLHATVGDDERYLLEHRTEPVRVRVHVDDILNELGFWNLYEAAHAELDPRYHALGIPTVSGVPGDPQLETALTQLQPATPEQQAAAEAIVEQHHRLEVLRQRELADYGQAFKANVHRAVADVFPGLRVPVEVITESRPQEDRGRDSAWNSPRWRLWGTVRWNTPLPGTGIAFRDYPTTATVGEIERAAGRDPLTRLEYQKGREQV
jgi:hypothetical protein